MGDTQVEGVKREPAHQRPLGFLFARPEVAQLDFGEEKLRPFPVNGVDGEGVADRTQMHPDLMGSARFDVGLHQGETSESVRDPVQG